VTSEGTKALLDKFREVRDSAMDGVAKATLAWTSSDAYQTIGAVISKPTFFTTALLRKMSDAAMTDLLAALNLPSRSDVLSLSKRLTRIEMVLDDMGAGMDEIRRGSGGQRRASASDHKRNGDGHPPVQPR
jgi:hypothetical protein